MAARFFEDPVPNMLTAVSRVEVGARYLDRMFGEDWVSRIDWDRLDIGSPFKCIVGQLIASGHFKLLLIPPRTGVECGFSCGQWDILSFARLPWVDRSYRRLTTAWRIMLLRRVADHPHLDSTQVRTLPRTQVLSDARRKNLTCAS